MDQTPAAVQKNPQFFLHAGPLLLILFIDGMGLGLVIPILNGLIFSGEATFLPKEHISPLLYDAIYGGIIGIFMLSWFFGAAILGDISDQIGRKRSLTICLVGAFVSYLISALSVTWHSLGFFIVGRVIAGFTSGSQPIAQAAIIDLSMPNTKARNIGYILLSLSLGFIFGPLIGGILADNRIVAWFDFSTPFYFASCISFLNILLLLTLFKETFVSKSRRLSFHPSRAIHIFISAFKHEKVRTLSILFFIFIFGWSSFYSFVALFLNKTFNFNTSNVSFYLALMGFGFGLGNGFVANYLAKRFELMHIFLVCTLLTGILIYLTTITQSIIFNWIVVAPISCVASTAYVSILTQFSNQVDEKSQGWVMGISGAIMAFVWGLNGIAVGFIAGLNASYPILIAAGSLFLTAILSGWYLSFRAN